MKLAEYTKTGKRISMNRLLLAEDSKKNRVIYNYDDLSSIGVVAKVEVEYDEMALEGDSEHTYIYPRNPMNHHYYHQGADELDDYSDKAKLLVGKKILLKDRFSESGRIVKIKNCVYRNDGIDLDYYFWEIDFTYLNEFANKFAPKKKKEKKEDTDNGAALIPCIFIIILIILLTIVLGILTTFWGAVRYSSLAFFTCSAVANFIVLIIELECLSRLDKFVKC